MADLGGILGGFDESNPSSVKLCRTATTPGEMPAKASGLTYLERHALFARRGLSAEVNATVAIRATPPLSRKERYRR